MVDPTDRSVRVHLRAQARRTLEAGWEALRRHRVTALTERRLGALPACTLDLARASPSAIYVRQVEAEREAVPRSKPHAIFGGRFARNLWRLTRIYWASPAARQGGLLVLAVALEFGAVYGNVLIASAQRHVGDAVQDKQASAFFAAMTRFFVILL